ncbi:MAG: hypothetical protein PUG13_00865 [Streptococcus hyointestinalis]|nr:hypothetical protein [Streptococcus hyointestinalis]MDD6383958.1 hypothetical protein [Streptococcus hyointestinalis]
MTTKATKNYCLKLIDELGGCYYTIERCDYQKMRKIASAWRKKRTVISENGEVSVLRATTGEELWIFET